MSAVALSRRGLLASGAALLLPRAVRAVAGDHPVIRVEQGALRGAAAGGVVRFLGIPYAAAPIGARRFLPPASAPMWTGVRDALHFGDAPIQPDPPAMLHVGLHDYLGAGTSEDCLKLNIWAPLGPDRCPVLVWLHGGGNVSGAASQPQFDGAAFARDGVVCITVGYRVGALGFLELGGLLGARYRSSGVNGLRDQLAALRWVKSNVAAFGGDPARITLAGESAGAKDVIALLASPLSRGLVHAAIVESGGETVHDVAQAEAVASLVAEACAADGVGIEALLTMPPAKLLYIQTRAIAGYDRPWPFRAITGTDLLPVAPVTAFRRGAAGDVRLLIGTNADESILFVDHAIATQPLAQRDLANLPLAAVLPVEARYAAAYPNLDPLHRRVRLLTAEEYGLASFHLAEAHRASRAGTWVYRFARPAPEGPFAGWTPHTAELPFVWDALDTPMARAVIGPSTVEAGALRDAVHQRWLAFIKGNPPWREYDGELIMTFDRTSRMSSMDRAEYGLWGNFGL